MANEIEDFISKIDDRFGKGSMFLPKLKSSISVNRVKTNIHAIDSIIGGGIPLGRILEIFGPEQSGKTTFTLEVIKSFQSEKSISKKGVLFIDAEHALDPEYARNIGVDIDNIAISQPDNAEDALNILLTSAKSGLFSLIILDSVASMATRAQIDGEIGDANMASLAKHMSNTLKMLDVSCNKTQTTVIFTNQIRFKVGVFYGSPEFTPGGVALKFHASIRIDIRKKEPIADGSRIIGQKSRLKVVKNKVAPPFLESNIDIIYGDGIDVNGDLFLELVNIGVINRSGSTYYIDGQSVGSGKIAAIQYVKDNYKSLIGQINGGDK